ncbi:MULTISPECIES: TraY domain-containing protein [Legionella]|uniref:TraY domain-containing protein n=1 Tax=Legionella TaxID=445 RepID=UPI00104137C0|nr:MULTISPECIES: TraY domain-containing protein [Legionella]
MEKRTIRGWKLEFDNHFRKVYISFQLSAESNELLTDAAKRSNRKKVQEAKLRLDDHLKRFRSISEIDFVVPSDGISNK